MHVYVYTASVINNSVPCTPSTNKALWRGTARARGAHSDVEIPLTHQLFVACLQIACLLISAVSASNQIPVINSQVSRLEPLKNIHFCDVMSTLYKHAFLAGTPHPQLDASVSPGCVELVHTPHFHFRHSHTDTMNFHC